MSRLTTPSVRTVMRTPRHQPMKQFLFWMDSLLITVPVPPLVGMGLIMWQVTLFSNWIELRCIESIPDCPGCPLSPGMPLTVPAVQTELGQDESPDLPPPPDIWQL